MLLHMDNFAVGAGTLADRYTLTGSPTVVTTNPRQAGGSSLLTTSTSTAIRRTLSPAATTTIVAVAFRTPTAATALAPSIALLGDNNARTHLSVVMNSSGQLELHRGDNTGPLLATGATVLANSTWYQLQIKATVADSGGICQVRLDGASTNEIDYTGDTKNAGTNSTIDRVLLTSAASMQWTDLAIFDGTGSTNNDWPGDVTVYTLAPTGNGSQSDLVGSDGNSVDNYALVNQLPWSSAQYVGSPTVGARDLYALADLPSGVTDIRGVALTGLVAKSDTGTGTSKLASKNGSTVTTSPAKTLTTTFATQTLILETNPATSAPWTSTEVNATEAGVEVAA